MKNLFKSVRWDFVFCTVMFFILGFAVGTGLFCGLTFYLLNGSGADFQVLLDFLKWW